MTSEPRGIVLFGPPAVGKDTITEQIVKNDERFVHFQKLKIGSGRTMGYRVGTDKDLSTLVNSGRIASQVERYGNRYVVDLPELEKIWEAGKVPIVHTSSFDELAKLTSNRVWRAWCLWAPLRTIRGRLLGREDSDYELRLDLYSAMLRGLGCHRPHFDRIIDTSAASPQQSAVSLLDGSRDERWDRNLSQLLSDPDLVVPVVTLRNRDGSVDWSANDQYARLASSAGTSVLVAGNTDMGTTLSTDDRQKLGQIWLRHLGPGLVNLAAINDEWPTDTPQGIRPVLVPHKPGIAGLENLSTHFPNCIAHSRATLGWRLPDDLRTPDPAPFAVKLSDSDVESARKATSVFKGAPRVWFGGSSSAAEALYAGIETIISAPLAAAICMPLPTSWKEILAIANQEQLQSTSTENRIAVLSRRVRKILAEQ